MESFHGRVKYVHFTHSTLVNDPPLLGDLSQFYCNIWKYDEHFQEFVICPECSTYYSESQVLSGITYCTNPIHTDPVLLVPAWTPEKVAEEILEDTAKYGDKLYSIVALREDTNRVVGFCWGFLMTWPKIGEKFGPLISDYLNDGNPEGAVYFSELASDRNLRGSGIGRHLIYYLTYWMKQNYPELPTFLRTHDDSKAHLLFESVGYRYFSDDPEHGAGRIMMNVVKCDDLMPENLL